MVCIDEHRNTKSHHNNSFAADALPDSKSSFFQQYQLIIFIAFTSLCTGLIILTLFALIFVLLKTRRQQTNPLRPIRWDGKFSSRETFLLNCIIRTMPTFDSPDDVSLFESTKHQQKKSSDKNRNHLHGNTIKHHLNTNDVDSVSSSNSSVEFIHPSVSFSFHTQ